MAWAFVQSKSAAANAVALTGSVAAGNMLVASAVTTGGADSVTFTDNTGGTWVTDKTIADGADGNTVAVGRAANHGSGVTTVTATGSPNGVALITVQEYSGIAPTSPTDQTSGQTISGTTSPTSGATAALAAAHELTLGACFDAGGGGTLTAGTCGSGTGTLREVLSGSDATEDGDSGAGTTGVSATFTDTVSAGNKVVICVVYKIPTAAGGGPIKSQTILQAVNRAAVY